jgi:hypothetical protein
VPTRIVQLTTATGVFPTGGVDLGGSAYRFATFAWANPSTRAIEGTVEGSIGGADNWATVITLTTANTTGAVLSAGGTTGGLVFDKLRVNLSGNESTSATQAWLAASD